MFVLVIQYYINIHTYGDESDSKTEFYYFTYAGKKVKGRTKLKQEQIWNGFQGFHISLVFR